MQADLLQDVQHCDGLFVCYLGESKDSWGWGGGVVQTTISSSDLIAWVSHQMIRFSH